MGQYKVTLQTGSGKRMVWNNGKLLGAQLTGRHKTTAYYRQF
jgi:hypothetical protein